MRHKRSIPNRGFRIADHSVVWMMANVAEGDIDAVKPGESVKVTTRAHPGRTFMGKVTVIYPHLTKETRTIPVRIEMPNPDMALLPDMYGDVEIATGNATALTVPSGFFTNPGLPLSPCRLKTLVSATRPSTDVTSPQVSPVVAPTLQIGVPTGSWLPSRKPLTT